MDARAAQARDFFYQRVAEQAAREGRPLTPAESRLLRMSDEEEEALEPDELQRRYDEVYATDPGFDERIERLLQAAREFDREQARFTNVDPGKVYAEHLRAVHWDTSFIAQAALDALARGPVKMNLWKWVGYAATVFMLLMLVAYALRGN